MSVISQSPADTRRLGAALGQAVRAGDVILLYGQLGSGKTTLAQALAHAIGVRQRLRSPSFVVVSAYPLGRRSVRLLYHLDLYRLRRTTATDAAAIAETINDRQAVVLVEWANRLPRRLVPPSRTTAVRLAVQSDHRRVIHVTGRLSHFAPARLAPRPSAGSAGRVRARRRSA